MSEQTEIKNGRPMTASDPKCLTSTTSPSPQLVEKTIATLKDTNKSTNKLTNHNNSQTQ